MIWNNDKLINKINYQLNIKYISKNFLFFDKNKKLSLIIFDIKKYYNLTFNYLYIFFQLFFFLVSV